MTPLAQKIVRDAMEHRTPSFAPWVAKALANSECRCFEVTQVIDLISDLTGEGKFDPLTAAETGFLPAPLTWIEFASEHRRRGCLLERFDGSRPAVWGKPGYIHDFTKGMPGFCMTMAFDGDEGLIHLSRLIFTQCDDMALPLVVDDYGRLDVSDAEEDEYSPERYGRSYMAALAIINTPRIVGRRQHMPHAGLQRELARNRKMVGKFPLQAWTEIRLEVMPPVMQEREHETHLTGQKALHFCRAFLRIRLGKLEMVSSHWRGDPSIGIKQSRYTVVPARQGAHL